LPHAGGYPPSNIGKAAGCIVATVNTRRGWPYFGSRRAVSRRYGKQLRHDERGPERRRGAERQGRGMSTGSGENGALEVWIDQDLCTGDGICAQYAPEVFELDIDGLAYVKDSSDE